MNTYNSLSSVQSAIKEGKTTCRQLVEQYMQRIKERQNLNAFLEVFEQEALQKADETDKKIASGQAGRLAGAVIALKDNICYKGHKVTAGSKILKEFASPYSATVVECLLAEDAIIIGRTNCDEFAMGTSNENSAYGPVLNAADETRVPGGSSGGSAVAVQAGMCLAALGSDTGGSIRQPASFCNVVGFKPSYGRISRYGLIAYASSFDQIGVISRSVEDAALITEIIAGKDEYDATASSQKVPEYSRNLSFDKKPRIAVLSEALQLEGLDPEIKAQTEQILKKLKDSGCKINEAGFPYLHYLVPAYYILTTAEASSNLARYDGVRYGYRTPAAENMEEVYVKSRSEGFGKEVQRRIMLGTFVLSEGFYDRYYAQAQKVRRIIYEESKKILAENDFILLPTTPTPAFELGEKVKNPVSMYLADIFTVQANLAGLPAVSLPLGKSESGLPFGIQLIGEKFAEQDLFAFAHHLMQQ